ncbi:MAG TPA: M56 family metallopeptidase, partial [Bryobacteraceae bacterium]|nr:M56 family metallopeptidase [Bryobacteraceae bacterium]
MPLTFGLFRPVILLPVEASGWTAERRRLVLLHELVHIRRLDWLMQLVAQLACALYWFHPLMWLAALRLRQEREHTCDDCVLALGAKGSIYAEHLLDLARSLKPAARWSMEVAMAQPPALEKRLAALLDLQRDRRPVNRRTAAAVTVAALIAAALLAPGIAPAQNSGITLSGIVYDASKARVPGAVVTATNLETHGKEITQTDQVGAYKFAGIAAGNCTLEVKKPGFKAYQQTGVSLAPGVSREADVMLDVGQIAETVNVVGKRPPLQPAAEAQTPQRIR